MLTSPAALPSPLYRAEQVRELDRVAIHDLGIPGIELMERAGLAVFEVMRALWPAARRLVVACGGGNNGGDGFVVARHALGAGLDTAVELLGDPSRLKGDAFLAYERLCEAGLEPVPLSGQGVDEADVVVDALFGTGLDRPIEGAAAELITALDRLDVPVLSVDIPSGLHADTGRVLGTAVRAAASVGFIGLKQGMFTGEGKAHAGRIYFDDLDVPKAVYGCVEPSANRITYETECHFLGARRPTAHKGEFGHVLVIGGDQGFTGAAHMAAEAAARVGAGLVSVATRAAHAAVLCATRPELMCHGVESAAELDALMERATVVAIGPGLGRTPWALEMLRHALSADLPLVVDADALNLLAGSHERHAEWVLTPHPGEAGRLLSRTAQDVQGDRFAAVREIVDHYGGVCVLKGAGTLVFEEGATVTIADEGNPGMASGGMGDVLTGIIAGLVAQGLDLAKAARLGVCIHGRAGDRAAAAGERGLLAGDLLGHLRALANPARSGEVSPADAE